MNRGWYPGANANLLPSAGFAGTPFGYFSPGIGRTKVFNVPRAEYFDTPIPFGTSAFTVTNKVGRLAMTATNTAGGIGGGILVRNAPAPPYTIDLYGKYVWDPSANSAGGSLGIGLYNGVKYRIMQHVSEQFGAGATLFNFNAYQVDDLLTNGTDTILARDSITTNLSLGVFLRVTDDGINKRFWVSTNGLDYVNVYSESVSVFGVVTKVGVNIGASVENTQNAAVASVYNFTVTSGILGDAV